MDDDDLPLIELLVFIPHQRQQPDPELRTGHQPQYDPSPEEIRQRCLEIQATWTPQVEQVRSGRPEWDVEITETETPTNGKPEYDY